MNKNLSRYTSCAGVQGGNRSKIMKNTTRRKAYRRIFLLIFILFFLTVNIFAEEKELKSFSIEGVWENGGRFVEFLRKDKTSDELDMRIILKPYYRFVYEKTGNFKTSIEPIENSKSQFILKINYPFIKKAVILPICTENSLLFTSFYKRIPYETNEETLPEEYTPSGITKEKQDFALNRKKSPLYGFWIEQGSPDGILLYPNETPKWIDAYFFTETDYIRFRYWLDDLEYNTKKVYVKGNDGVNYEFPHLLKRGNLVYSCVTSTGRLLRNYETGTYSITSDLNAENTKSLFLSFKPLGAGPGTHAAADTYPKPQFSVLENLPLYIMDDNNIFAFGAPFLMRSEVKDLDKEIERHNLKRRPPPEPQLPNED